VIEGAELKKLGLSFPHTTHCLADGNVMISTLGDADGKAKGNFVLLDSKSFEVKGKWATEDTEFNYDYWYQPHHNVMISTAWGAPNALKTGFKVEDVEAKQYGHTLTVWDWKEHTIRKKIELDVDTGAWPLEIRFLHEPTSPHAFVGCALGSSVYHIFKTTEGEWDAEKVIEIPSKTVEGWVMPEMRAFITDIIISLDDRYLYTAQWFHGNIRQFDITDPSNPKLAGKLSVGGLFAEGSKIKIVKEAEVDETPISSVKSRRITGGPQMIQLSLDGTRLYVTTSLYSVWDQQFYPQLNEKGAVMMQVDVDVEKGGLTLNRDFLVDFGDAPTGPHLAHEMRYPGGDCSSDIWLEKFD
jgi:selenium-binding protein 1